MAFQQTVRFDQGHGIVGDIVIDGPRRGKPAILESIDASNNVIGRGFSYVVGSDDKVIAGKPGAETVFAGILVNSKVYASGGTQAGGALAPTLELPNGTVAELITMASGVQVVVNGATKIGNPVYMLDATGELGALDTPPANTTILPGVFVVRHSITEAGLAVVELTTSDPKYT